MHKTYEKYLRFLLEVGFVNFIAKVPDLLFQPSFRKYVNLLVWVKMFGYWHTFKSMGVFRKIGNSLGVFLEVDMNFLETRVIIVAKILVGLYLCEELELDIMLHKGFVEFL